MRTTALALAALLTGGSAALAAPVHGPFTSFWVLGDSLSDNGNLFAATAGTVPPSPPFFAGRFSDGPVWNEAIGAEFLANGKPFGNLAFGGAQAVPDADLIPDLPVQLGLFAGASAGIAGARPLVSLWFGANDIFAGLDAGTAIAAAEAAAAGVLQGVDALALGGVGDFLLFTLPDIGQTPAYALFDTANAADATAASDAFNADLIAGVGSRIAAGLNISVVGVDALFDILLADPAAFGVADATNPCVYPSLADAIAAGEPPVCADPSPRAFFDEVHPNAIIHASIEDAARRALSQTAAVPLPATAPLLIGALMLGGVAARRRRR